MNPYILSLIIQFILIGIFITWFKHSDPIFSLLIISLLLPVPIISFYQRFFLSDVLAFYYFFKYPAFNMSYLKKNSKIIYIYAFILILLLPFIASLLKVNSIKHLGDFILHIFRAIMVLTVLKVSMYKYKNNPFLLIKHLRILSLLWFFLLVISILQWTNVIDTNFIKYFSDAYGRTYLSGFMGLDKPQIALFSVVFINILLYSSLENWINRIIYLFLVILIVTITLLIGSRQGLLYLSLSFLLYIIFSFSIRNIFKNTAFILSIILALLYIAANTKGISKTTNYDPLINFVSGKTNISSLAESRDPLFLDSWLLMISNPENIVIGNGLGNEAFGYYENNEGVLVKDNSVTRTYFEGEIFRIMWTNGILGVIIFLIIAIKLIRIGWKNIRKDNIRIVSASRLLIVLTVLILLFSFGQFSLFTMNRWNTPFVYFIWWLLGSLISVITSETQNSKRKILTEN